MRTFSLPRFRVPGLIIGLVLLHSTNALAGPGRWTSGGPPDPYVTALATDPTDSGTLYAGTTTGLVFRSADAGRTWQGTRFRATHVNAIVVVPAAPSTIYVATTSGAFRSADTGTSWSAINSGLPPVSVESLAIDPRNPAVLYAGAAGYLSVNPTTTVAGLWKTSDRGTSWQPTGLQGSGVRSIAIDPRSSIVYVAPYAFPPMSANNGQGIWRSTDGGASWLLPEGNLGGPPFTEIVVDPSNPANVYAGWFCCAVFRSADGGRNWQRVDLTGEFIQTSSLVIDPAHPSHLYVGTERGVFRSVDAGTSWAPFNCGLEQLQIRALAIDSSGRFVHAGTASGGVFGYEYPSSGDVAGCPGGETTLCLSLARFCMQVRWTTSDGRAGAGIPLPITAESGAFWFFTPTNIELAVKVLDGSAVNGNYWMFYGAMTNVEFTLTVTDTRTGRSKVYFNPQGRLESVADTAAFPAF